MQTQHGTKLWLILLSLNIALFLTTLDGTIIATSLISIAAEFHNYDQSSWIVIAYSVTYSSFLIIFARLSDISGRRPALLAGLIFFIVASLACAVSRSSNQLIIFRAFQGIGASGIYAPALVIATEITPREKAAYLTASLSTVFALASAVGPVVGGAITTTTTWRWCFYLNLPAGALILGLVLFLIPKDTFEEPKRTLRQVDFLGASLCLAASIMTILPLQVGGDEYAWNSAGIISMFVVSGLCWIALATWEIMLDKRRDRQNIMPLLPVHIFKNRVLSACLLILFLTGIGFTSTVVWLPQKFEVANDLSSARAGIYMLPFVIVSALIGIVVGFCLSKGNFAASLNFLGNALQLLGLGLTSSLHGTAISSNANFAYQIIFGLGFGTTICSAFILARIEVDRKDIASTVGAVTQIRILGGVIGVGLSRVVLFDYVSDKLNGILSMDQIQAVLASVTNIDELSPSQASTVRDVYGDGFADQTRVLMYVAAVNVVAALLTFRRHAKPLQEVQESASNVEPAPIVEHDIELAVMEEQVPPNKTAEGSMQGIKQT